MIKEDEEFKNANFVINKILSDNYINIIDKKTIDFLATVIIEISKNENVSIRDFDFVGQGMYSIVYKWGNKVLKIGHKRIMNEIPYHKRILQPLLRKRVPSANGLDDKLFIEVSEYAKPLVTDEDFENNFGTKKEKETEDIVYSIFKELKKDGIAWIDARGQNLGILTKENTINMKDQFDAKNETVGYIKETIKDNDKPLQPGELVIIDTDAILTQKDFDEGNYPDYISTFWYHYYNKRYEKELEQEELKKAKNISEDSDIQR